MTENTQPDFRPLDWSEIRKLQKIIGQGNAERGFHEEGDRLRAISGGTTRHAGKSETFTDKALRNYYTARLALITTEVAEAIEELRNGRAIDETYYPTSPDGNWADVEIIEPDEDGNPQAIVYPYKPEGVPSELADVVIRTFDFAAEAGIDLAAMIEEKLAFNSTRGHKHGKEF